ncbi:MULTISPECIES: conjugative transposon protein TraM [Chryseobacterium group]|jgi:conjugative transposon TraM protein|uniref:Conjugative transposon protein TraM n=4 Tax=Chryseobacterium TaxID=59732 RepID=A0AAJ1R4U9_9FLAO|nr:MULTISPECIES: conjugative transposon protein TraM [Chryseobacterium group]EFK33185.1 conjugative transposon TraM protein [Chryseobacterium gleum ATCC 35910]MDN4013277.1 conjugative transposon protein TraM [Chryseobacterium gambrini]MDN4028869.1 conjugative transposon protein TraM [Chryseobacterium gambrini]MDO3425163.1 conjugative transposon protein TraM [Chryseobacterium sp. APV1]QQY33994.1 conjugative transposon protein TraM [Chryseobacterium gleum]
MKKLNLKQPKYVLPLIALPFVLMIGYFYVQFTENSGKDKNKLAESKDISTDFGKVGERSEIKGKADAYADFFDKRTDGRTMIDGFGDEHESLEKFDDDLSERQKRHIDSMNYVREKERLNNLSRQANRQSYYNAMDAKQSKEREDDQYDRSMKMLKMLNGDNNGVNNSGKADTRSAENSDWKKDQMTLMREQMMLMDSIEKANNPELKNQAKAIEKMKKNEKEMDFFLNSTLDVTKASKSTEFNSIFRQRENNFIKAVIDENIKGFAGSRIRIRLLEDVYVGNAKISKGTPLYALISGFSLQRVNLNIVSVMHQNEILPISLNIYDVDGMEGLYVPSSAFREMTRSMGENIVQGQNLSSGSADFFTTTLSSVYQSTSKTISDVIRKNKAKIKYNSFVYLIDNKELEKKKKNIYKKNTNP